MASRLGNCCTDFMRHHRWVSLGSLAIVGIGCFLAGRWAISWINKKPEWVVPVPCQKVNLENLYEDHICCEVDMNKKCDFDNYINLNETYPENISPHLQGLEEGLLGFIGAERVFVQLLFVNEASCTGVVSRDINHRAKAYKDFKILLFKLSKNLKEYSELNTVDIKNPQEIENRLNAIKSMVEKMNPSQLSPKMRDYYLKYLKDFGLFYYLHNKSRWSDPFVAQYFPASAYDQNEEQFLKIQRYVMAGSLISTIGDVNDLKFLANQKITLVDVSNIPDYIPIDLQGGKNFSPKILWTSGTGAGQTTTYSSEEYQVLDEVERKEFEDLLDILKKSFDDPVPFNDPEFAMLFKIQVNYPCLYSKNGLKHLKVYIDKFVLKCDDLVINLKKAETKIRNLTLSQAQRLARMANIRKYLPIIFCEYRYWNPVNLLAFMDVDGWNEEFKKLFSPNQMFSFELNRQFFLEYLKEGSIYTHFKNKVGQEDWKKLGCVMNLSAM